MDDEQDFLIRYGQWVRDDQAPPDVRSAELAALIAVLLRRTVAHDAVQVIDVGGVRAVSFDHEGRDHFVSCVVEESGTRENTVARIVRAAGLTGQRGDTRWAHLSWTRAQSSNEELIEGVRGFGVVLDSTHVDAAVAGLLPLADLIRDVFRRRETYLPLAALVTRPAADTPVPTMAAAARLSTPAQVPSTVWAGAACEVLLVGGAQERHATGMVWRGFRSLLATSQDGVCDIDPVTGDSRWLLTLPGCHGAPLVAPDGSVLVMCGPALVRWHQGVVSALAGGFDPGAQLLAGPDQEPWVLSGCGVTFGTGEGTLALTWAGDAVGNQMRYPVAFEAAVRSAVWLGDRRFFLAASGHSAVVDLSRTTELGGRDQWIPTPGHYPAHLLAAGPDSVLSASADGSGNGITVHRTAVGERSSEPVADLRLGQVFGLTQEPRSGSAYLLASLPTNATTRIQPVLVRLSGYRPTAADLPSETDQPTPGFDLVSRCARGVQKDYRLDRLPLASEGQGEVFRAEHKRTGTEVAYKRSKGKGTKNQRRMKREVAIAQMLGGHPHVMPVLDFSPAYDWFVMPMAQATAQTRRTELQNDDALRELVDAVASALARAHEADWIHRDIKPANILLLDGRWTVADWGIVRRARGQSSAAGPLTGAEIGTLGFAPPELSTDPHEGATPASDVYSLGQLIGWILTGTWPQANVPLLPPAGPWRGVVRQATYLDAAQRPQTMAAFLALVEQEIAPQTDLPITRAQTLLTAIADGDEDAAAQLLVLAANQPDNYELYLDAVTRLDMDSAETALLANPVQAIGLTVALASHVKGDRGQWPTNIEADRAIWWLLGVARTAAREEEWGLLDAAAQGMCIWDGAFDQWKPQDSINDWLRRLSGPAASAVASVLREHPSSARHFWELESERGVDTGLRSVIRAAVSPTPNDPQRQSDQ
ncbi:serine/threonine-protein kinase [Streptomyces sp. NPDC050439]|uniref:serine/threonine-protein kinase n=1 Tax=unclassified Streptomyces TaxID=2593676 RepID=UPI00341753EE